MGFPQGFEGDVVVGMNNETVAVKFAVLKDGQLQNLPPVVVAGTSSAPVTQSAPVVAGTSAPRLCSPEEFQAAMNQPGASAPLTLTPDEFAKMAPGQVGAPGQVAAPGFGQAQVVQGAFQPQPPMFR